MKAQLFNVRFVGQHFVMFVTVNALDEEDAIRRASALMWSHYEWDVKPKSDVEITAEVFL